MSFRKFFGLSVSSAILGAVVAIAAPPQGLTAAAGCKCDDTGSGSYACNFEQTKCVAGSEACMTICQE